jgi:hypothetical protein
MADKKIEPKRPEAEEKAAGARDPEQAKAVKARRMRKARKLRKARKIY